MPTDLALVLIRKAEAEAQAWRDVLTDLALVVLWAVTGLVFTVRMCNQGFDPGILSLLVNG